MNQDASSLWIGSGNAILLNTANEGQHPLYLQSVGGGVEEEVL